MEGRVIEDNSEKERLLDNIFHSGSSLSYGSSRQWSNAFYGFFINMPVSWTLIEGVGLEYKWADLYAEKYGKWYHSGGSHNILGMAFAWWMKEMYHSLDGFSLSDSPDFRGTCRGRPFAGDIGECTPIALLDGIRSLGMHSLWITVMSMNKQLVLEFNYNVGLFISHCIGERLVSHFGGFDRERAIKDTFWCEDCQMWTVTEKSRNDIFMV